MLGFVVTGEQNNTLFDLRELLLQIINVCSLDIIHDHAERETVEFPGIKQLFFEYPKQSCNKFGLLARCDLLSSISLHYLWIKIAVVGHGHPTFKLDTKFKEKIPKMEEKDGGGAFVEKLKTFA